MAIDTAAKRKSAIGVGLHWLRLGLIPDNGNLSAPQRLHTQALYAGIAAGAPILITRVTTLAMLGCGCWLLWTLLTLSHRSAHGLELGVANVQVFEQSKSLKAGQIQGTITTLIGRKDKANANRRNDLQPAISTDPRRKVGGESQSCSHAAYLFTHERVSQPRHRGGEGGLTIDRRWRLLAHEVAENLRNRQGNALRQADASTSW